MESIIYSSSLFIPPPLKGRDRDRKTNRDKEKKMTSKVAQKGSMSFVQKNCQKRHTRANTHPTHPILQGASRGVSRQGVKGDSCAGRWETPITGQGVHKKRTRRIPIE